jgi:hypothetical protein
MKVECEHTDDPELTKQIAKAHLSEDPNYYKKLKVMEAGGRMNPDGDDDNPTSPNILQRTPFVMKKKRRGL